MGGRKGVRLPGRMKWKEPNGIPPPKTNPRPGYPRSQEWPSWAGPMQSHNLPSAPQEAVFNKTATVWLQRPAGGGCTGVGTRGMRGLSAPATQVCSEPKTALNNKIYSFRSACSPKPCIQLTCFLSAWELVWSLPTVVPAYFVGHAQVQGSPAQLLLCPSGLGQSAPAWGQRRAQGSSRHTSFVGGTGILKSQWKDYPQEAAVREMETKALCLQILLPLPPSIFQNGDRGTASANSIISLRLTEFGPLPICHFFGEGLSILPKESKSSNLLSEPNL